MKNLCNLHKDTKSLEKAAMISIIVGVVIDLAVVVVVLYIITVIYQSLIM